MTEHCRTAAAASLSRRHGKDEGQPRDLTKAWGKPPKKPSYPAKRPLKHANTQYILQEIFEKIVSRINEWGLGFSEKL